MTFSAPLCLKRPNKRKMRPLQIQYIPISYVLANLSHPQLRPTWSCDGWCQQGFIFRRRRHMATIYIAGKVAEDLGE